MITQRAPVGADNKAKKRFTHHIKTLRGGQSRTALQVRYIRVSEGGEGDGGREELSKREARGGGEQTHLNRSCSHLLVYNVRQYVDRCTHVNRL